MAGKRKKRIESTNRSGKSFALKHWEAFEKLSMKIVSEKYQERPGVFFEQTSPRGDGGYDGIICFPVSSKHSSELYKILLEAKLRSSSNHDLPLSDFSKTIIIAVNTIADKVYISTNAYFSAETNKRLKTYSQRIGLEIHTLDICSITSWINANRTEAEKICTTEFLNAIMSMERSLKPEQRMLTCDSEQLYNDEIPKLYGKKRRALLQTLSRILSEQNGVLIIKAPEGSGKTVFVDHLIREVQQDYRRIANFDFIYFSDVREVFVHLVAIAWGIEPSEIYGMRVEDLEEITEHLGDHKFPPKSRATLINLIHQPQETFNQNRTLHTELLLDYLRIIYPPILKRVRCLLIISNLASGTRNALDFLSSFIKILSDHAISFLIEVDSGRNLNYTDHVSRFASEMERESNYLDTFPLPPWDFTDATEFLYASMPWLSGENQRQLITFFGLHPLALSAGARAIQKSDLTRVLKLSNVGIPSLAAQKRFALGCIDHIVEEFAVAGGQAVQCSLILLALLDGEAEISLLEEVAFSNGFLSPREALCLCPFLRAVGTKIRVLHGVYQNSISKFRFVTRSFLYQVLTHAEPLLIKYYSDPEYILRKRFSILQIQRNFEGVRCIWMQLAVTHLAHGETELVYEVLKTVYEWWMEDTTHYQINAYEQYWLLYHLSATALELDGANSTELRYYIDQLDAVLRLTPEEEWPGGQSNLHLAKAEALDLKCRVALGQADYENMLMYADEGISLLMGKLTTQERYCVGDLWANKALAIKHLKNLSECVLFLESGKEFLDGVTPFVFCYYTHLSSLHSIKRPRTALRYFEKIKEECECTLPQLLHTDHNIATMHFTLGEYEQAAQISGRVWVTAYENNVAIEEGRSNHLMGCISWVKNDLEGAYEHFSAAHNLFQRHVHRTHLWPPLINLSSLCFEMGRRSEALSYTNIAADFVLKFHLASINHLDMSTDVLPKIFVGVLILLDHYEHLCIDASLKKELLEKIDLSELHDAYINFVQPGRLDSLLDGTGYIVDGKRIIKV